MGVASRWLCAVPCADGLGEEDRCAGKDFSAAGYRGRFAGLWAGMMPRILRRQHESSEDFGHRRSRHDHPDRFVLLNYGRAEFYLRSGRGPAHVLRRDAREDRENDFYGHN